MCERKFPAATKIYTKKAKLLPSILPTENTIIMESLSVC